MKDDDNFGPTIRSFNGKIRKDELDKNRNSIDSLEYPLKQSKIFPLKKCPFCERTPNLSMDITLNTWLPRVKCDNVCCVIKPSGPYFAIRKAQKFDLTIIRRKICHAINAWNDNCPTIASGGRMVDWEEILQKSLQIHNKEKPNGY
jgi:hypothetical protein